MTEDKKTLKFQMMMSPAEAEVLDDWMFQNRVRSRAEAIRRLCQMGMILEDFMPRLNDETLAHKEFENSIKPVMRKARNGELPPDVAEALENAFAEVMIYQTRMMAMSSLLLLETAPLKSHGDVNEAINAASELKAALNELDLSKREDRMRLTDMMVAANDSLEHGTGR